MIKAGREFHLLADKLGFLLRSAGIGNEGIYPGIDDKTQDPVINVDTSGLSEAQLNKIPTEVFIETADRNIYSLPVRPVNLSYMLHPDFSMTSFE